MADNSPNAPPTGAAEGPVPCRQCGRENSADSRFCNQCGAKLAPAAAAERRQLTVMFCDLVGSTALSERLDPEDLREVLGAYQTAAASAIARQEGHIAQYLGDGLLVYFGYPLAHEDDARRSVLAALDVIAALDTLNARADQPQLAVRIGIHTGPVVVGEVGAGARREQLALGETPNLAARLQGLAAPGTIVVSGATQRLVSGDFGFESLGRREVKGLAAPVDVWRVTGSAGARAASRRTPLVGRERETALLRELWASAVHSRGHAVLVKGEPGIGKSRFALALRDEVRRAGSVAFESRCSPYFRNSAFHPVIELIERVAGIGREEPAERKFAKLEAAIGPLFGGAGDAVPMLAALLSIPLPAHVPAPLLSPQAARERTFEALIGTLRAAAAQVPALLVVEDLQWADPSTLELVRRLIPRAETDRLLLLLTARPEFRAPWHGDDGFSELTLDSCSDDEARAIVTAIAGDRPLAAPVIARIVARTEGIPLFIEEFTRAALDAGGEERSQTPMTLQDLLMARLDRLGPAKAVLQQAAVIGRNFPFGVLAAISGTGPAPLAAALARCVEDRLLSERGVAPDSEYAFAHALFQDAAYQSLLRSARQQCHRRVAEAIATQSPSTAELEPEVLAFHYTEAAMPAEAIGQWLRAGRHALGRSACLEAQAHAERGLALARAMAQDVAQANSELDLELVLGSALMAMHGVAAADVEQTYARCHALCDRIGQTAKLVVPLWGLWGYALVRGRFEEAHGFSTDLGRLAETAPQSGIALVAAETLGITRFYMGDLAAARAQFARGIELYRAPKRTARIEHGVHQPGVMCRAFDMLACWLTGLPGQALVDAARLQEIARAWSPFDTAFTCCADAILHQFAREPAAVLANATRAVAIASEQGFAAWRAEGTVLRGWAIARLGNADDGISRLRRGYEAWCATGANNLRPYLLMLLGDACLAARRHDDAAEALQDAFDAIAESGERCWEPEVQRLRGEAMLAMEPARTAEAESCFRAAIEIAVAQGARGWELRAATSLARSLGNRGERAEARNLLTAVLASFGEGAAVHDVREARMLLA